MGYTLHAFIAKRGTFDEYKKLGERVTVAHINDTYDLLLNDVYLDQALGFQETSIDPEEFEYWLLSKESLEFFKQKSKETLIAYVKADYTGGTGFQKSVVWKDGAQILKSETEILPRPHSYGPVNDALRALGVVAMEGRDEFETVGLHRNQQMEDWFEEATGIHWMKYLEEY